MNNSSNYKSIFRYMLPFNKIEDKLNINKCYEYNIIN